MKDEYLKKYPRICGHLICESLGYLTPGFANDLLQAVHKREEFFCEWTFDIHLKSGNSIETVCHNIARAAIKNRRYHKGSMSSYPQARAVIKSHLNGREPFGASWF